MSMSMLELGGLYFCNLTGHFKYLYHNDITICLMNLFIFSSANLRKLLLKVIYALCKDC